MDQLGSERTNTGAKGLAERWDVPLQTIYSMRHRGQGPPAFLVGRSLRFRLCDIEKWEQERLSLKGGRGR